MTIVPRTGPLSASSALVMMSWYQRGKSSAWGVSTGALAMGADATAAPSGPRPPSRPPAGADADEPARSLSKVGGPRPATDAGLLHERYDVGEVVRPGRPTLGRRLRLGRGLGLGCGC